MVLSRVGEVQAARTALHIPVAGVNVDEGTNKSAGVLACAVGELGKEVSNCMGWRGLEEGHTKKWVANSASLSSVALEFDRAQDTLLRTSLGEEECDGASNGDGQSSSDSVVEARDEVARRAQKCSKKVVGGVKKIKQGFEAREKVLSGLLTRARSLDCLLYTSPSPRDQRGSRMPSSA